MDEISAIDIPSNSPDQMQNEYRHTYIHTSWQGDLKRHKDFKHEAVGIKQQGGTYLRNTNMVNIS